MAEVRFEFLILEAEGPSPYDDRRNNRPITVNGVHSEEADKYQDLRGESLKEARRTLLTKGWNEYGNFDPLDGIIRSVGSQLYFVVFFRRL